MTLPKPYFERDGITLYHADARHILPLLHGVDWAVVSDVPYGVQYVHGEGGGCLAQSTRFSGIAIIGDDAPFNPENLLELGLPMILWGANHYASRLPDSPCWLVWDKRDGVCSNDQADCELAWTSLKSPARLKRLLWNGMLKATERGEARQHPTQKPVALIKWCLSFFPDAKIILDPFCGSGTTLVAAKLDGRKAIGIEIDERYCEISARRLEQGVLDFAGAAQRYRQPPVAEHYSVRERPAPAKE